MRESTKVWLATTLSATLAGIVIGYLNLGFDISVILW